MYDPILSNILGIPLNTEEEELELRRRRRAEMESLGLIVPSDDFTGPDSEASAYLNGDVPTGPARPQPTFRGPTLPATSPAPLPPPQTGQRTLSQPPPSPFSSLRVDYDPNRLERTDLLGRSLGKESIPTRAPQVPPGTEGIIGKKPQTPTLSISEILSGTTASASKSVSPPGTSDPNEIPLNNGVRLKSVGKNRYKGSDNQFYLKQGEGYVNEKEFRNPNQIKDKKGNAYNRISDGPQGTKGIYSFNNQKFVLKNDNSLLPEVEFRAQQAERPELYEGSLKPISFNLLEAIGKKSFNQGDKLTDADHKKMIARMRKELNAQGVNASDFQLNLMLGTGLKPDGTITIDPKGLARFKAAKTAKSIRFEPVLEKLYADGADLTKLDDNELGDIGLSQSSIAEWLNGPNAKALAQTRQINLDRINTQKGLYLNQLKTGGDVPGAAPGWITTNENGNPVKRRGFSANPMEALAPFRSMDKAVQDQAAEVIAREQSKFIDAKERNEKLTQIYANGLTRQSIQQAIQPWRDDNTHWTDKIKQTWNPIETNPDKWTDEQLLNGENAAFDAYVGGKIQQFGSIEKFRAKQAEAQKEWDDASVFGKVGRFLAVTGTEIGASITDIGTGALMLTDLASINSALGRAINYVGDTDKGKYLTASYWLTDEQGETAGDWIRSGDYYKRYHGYSDEFTYAAIAGNLISFMGPQVGATLAARAGGLAAKTATKVAMGTSWATGASMMLPGVYTSLRGAGYNHQSALNWATGLSVPLGATEMFGIGRIIPKTITKLALGEVSQGTIKTLARDAIRNGSQSMLAKVAKASPYYFGKEFLEETAQETFQSALQGGAMKALTEVDPETGKLREGWSALMFAFANVPNEAVDALPHAMAGGLLGGGLGVGVGVGGDVYGSRTHVANLQREFQRIARTDITPQVLGEDGKPIELSEEDIEHFKAAKRWGNENIWNKFSKAMGIMRKVNSAPASEREGLISEAAALFDQANAALTFADQTSANRAAKVKMEAGEASVGALTEEDFEIKEGGYVATPKGLGVVQGFTKDGNIIVKIRADVDGKGNVRVFTPNAVESVQPSLTLERARAERDAEYTGEGITLLNERLEQVRGELDLISNVTQDRNGKETRTPADGQEQAFDALSAELNALEAQKALVDKYDRPPAGIAQDSFLNAPNKKARKRAWDLLKGTAVGQVVTSTADGSQLTVTGVGEDQDGKPYYTVAEDSGTVINGQNALYLEDADWGRVSDSFASEERAAAIQDGMNDGANSAQNAPGPLVDGAFYEPGTPVTVDGIGPALIVEDQGENVRVVTDDGSNTESVVPRSAVTTAYVPSEQTDSAQDEEVDILTGEEQQGADIIARIDEAVERKKSGRVTVEEVEDLIAEYLEFARQHSNDPAFAGTLENARRKLFNLLADAEITAMLLPIAGTKFVNALRNDALRAYGWESAEGLTPDDVINLLREFGLLIDQLIETGQGNGWTAEQVLSALGGSSPLFSAISLDGKDYIAMGVRRRMTGKDSKGRDSMAGLPFTDLLDLVATRHEKEGTNFGLKGADQAPTEQQVETTTQAPANQGTEGETVGYFPGVNADGTIAFLESEMKEGESLFRLVRRPDGTFTAVPMFEQKIVGNKIKHSPEAILPRLFSVAAQPAQVSAAITDGTILITKPPVIEQTESGYVVKEVGQITTEAIEAARISETAPAPETTGDTEQSETQSTDVQTEQEITPDEEVEILTGEEQAEEGQQDYDDGVVMLDKAAKGIPSNNHGKQIRTQVNILIETDRPIRALDAISKLEGLLAAGLAPKAEMSQSAWIAFGTEMRKALDALEESLKQMGYERVQTHAIGMPWVEGMEVAPEFVRDANLFEGQFIIKKVKKPTITKNGEVIQVGEVVVAQGTKVQDTQSDLVEKAKEFETYEEFRAAVFGEAPEYGMSHRPTYEGMPPAHDLLEGGAIPDDVYEKPELSIASNLKKDQAEQESWAVLQAIRDNPRAKVTIYRAGPSKQLNIGDWVTFSKTYAEINSQEEGSQVYSFEVEARDVIFAGDYINEFGYFPESLLEKAWNEAKTKPAQKAAEAEGKKESARKQEIAKKAKAAVADKGLAGAMEGVTDLEVAEALLEAWSKSPAFDAINKYLSYVNWDGNSFVQESVHWDNGLDFYGDKIEEKHGKKARAEWDALFADREKAMPLILELRREKRDKEISGEKLFPVDLTSDERALILRVGQASRYLEARGLAPDDALTADEIRAILNFLPKRDAEYGQWGSKGQLFDPIKEIYREAIGEDVGQGEAVEEDIDEEVDEEVAEQVDEELDEDEDIDEDDDGDAGAQPVFPPTSRTRKYPKTKAAPTKGAPKVGRIVTPKEGPGAGVEWAIVDTYKEKEVDRTVWVVRDPEGNVAVITPDRGWTVTDRQVDGPLPSAPRSTPYKSIAEAEEAMPIGSMTIIRGYSNAAFGMQMVVGYTMGKNGVVEAIVMTRGWPHTPTRINQGPAHKLVPHFDPTEDASQRNVKTREALVREHPVGSTMAVVMPDGTIKEGKVVAHSPLTQRDFFIAAVDGKGEHFGALVQGTQGGLTRMPVFKSRKELEAAIEKAKADLEQHKEKLEAMAPVGSTYGGELVTGYTTEFKVEAEGQWSSSVQIELFDPASGFSREMVMRKGGMFGQGSATEKIEQGVFETSDENQSLWKLVEKGAKLYVGTSANSVTGTKSVTVSGTVEKVFRDKRTGRVAVKLGDVKLPKEVDSWSKRELGQKVGVVDLAATSKTAKDAGAKRKEFEADVETRKVAARKAAEIGSVELSETERGVMRESFQDWETGVEALLDGTPLVREEADSLIENIEDYLNDEEIQEFLSDLDVSALNRILAKLRALTGQEVESAEAEQAPEKSRFESRFDKTVDGSPFLQDIAKDNAVTPHSSSAVAIKIGEAFIYMTPGEDGVMIIDDFRVSPEAVGKGQGSAALKKLTEYADKHGITLIGDPVAQSDSGRKNKKQFGLSQDELLAFYERNGFGPITMQIESAHERLGATADWIQREPGGSPVGRKQEPQAASKGKPIIPELSRGSELILDEYAEDYMEEQGIVPGESITPEQARYLAQVLDDNNTGDLPNVTRDAEGLRDAADESEGKQTPRQKAAPKTETVTETPTNKTQTVYAGDIKVPVEQKVISADDIITSEQEGYPSELQPRDTSRKSSAAFVTSIAADLDTDKLGDETFAGNGRPIVVPVKVNGQTKYAVIAGNHRVGAIRQRYNQDTNEEYEGFAQEKGEAAGQDTEGINSPIYVGVISDPGAIDLVEFARQANAPQQRAMSTAEQAIEDAKKLTPAILSKLVVSENGDLGTTANEAFIRDFLLAVGEERASAYRTASGQMSQDGFRAMRAAIFAAAYADTQEGADLLERVFESEDSNIKRITSAMLLNAAAFAQLKADVANGNRFEGLDISADLTAMAVKYADLRAEGMPVSEFLQQGNLFGGDLTPIQVMILEMLESKRNSAKALSAILQNYLRTVDEMGSPKQMNMFSDAENRGAASILQGAIEFNEENGNDKQQGLFGKEFGPQDNQENQGTAPAEDGGTAESEYPTSPISQEEFAKIRRGLKRAEVLEWWAKVSEATGIRLSEDNKTLLAPEGMVFARSGKPTAKNAAVGSDLNFIGFALENVLVRGLSELAPAEGQQPDTQQEVNDGIVEDALDTLEESEIETLEEVYGEERGSQGFMAKVREDLTRFAQKGAKGVKVKLRKIIAKLATAVLATAMILHAVLPSVAVTKQLPTAATQTATQITTTYAKVSEQFKELKPSLETALVVDWAMTTNAHENKPAAFVDKKNGIMYILSATGELLSARPVITGLSKDYDRIDETRYKDIKAYEDFDPKIDRATQAGKFDLIPEDRPNNETWLYFSMQGPAFAAGIHRNWSSAAAERSRALETATPEDNFGTYGCISTSDEDYANVIAPIFVEGKKRAQKSGTIFVIPGSSALEEFFPEAASGEYTPTPISSYVIYGQEPVLPQDASAREDMTADRRSLPISRQTGRRMKDATKYEFKAPDARNLQDQGELLPGGFKAPSVPVGQERGAGEEDRPLGATSIAPKTIKGPALLPGLTQEAPEDSDIREGRKGAALSKNAILPNVPKNLDLIDEALDVNSDPEKSEDAWARYWAYLTKNRTVPIAPYNLIAQLRKKLPFGNLLTKLSDGQIKDANAGLEAAKRFRRLYTSGVATPTTTAKLALWGLLSRGVSPYVQESMFLFVADKIAPWIEQAEQGKFDFEKYEAWVKGLNFEEGLPANGTKHNLNSFGEHFLVKMSEEAEPGKSGIRVLHDWIADKKLTGPQIRRLFHSTFQGVGFDNKVLSFMLLVTGRTDVLVLDRVQIRNLFDDGRFKGQNLYDGDKHTTVYLKSEEKDGPKTPLGKLYQEEGESDKDFKAAVEALKADKAAELGVDIERIGESRDTTTGSSIEPITSGLWGLATYEAIERAIERKLQAIYDGLGRGDVASLGRLHWETWVVESGQEAGHGTLEGLYKEAAGKKAPYEGVTAKEGQYDTYSYGAEFGMTPDGQPFLRYTDSKNGKFVFTPKEFTTFLSEIQKRKNGIVPAGFKVSENTRRAWYENKQVNRKSLDDLIAKIGRPESDGVIGKNAERSAADGKVARRKSDRPLGATRQAEAEAKIAELRRKPLSTEVLKKATAKLTANGVELNLEATVFLESVAQKVFGRTAGFDGMFFQKGNTRKLLKAVRATEAGLRQKGRNDVADVVKNIGDVMESGLDRDTLLVYLFDDKVPHEALHKFRYLSAEGANIIERYDDFNALLGTERDGVNLVETAYKNFLMAIHQGRAWEDLTISEKAEVWEEAFVEASTGNFAALGLTLEQAQALYVADLEAFTAKNGEEVLNDIEEFIDARFKNVYQTGRDEGAVPETPAGPPGGVQETEEGGQERGEEGAPEPRRETPKYAERVLETGIITYDVEGMSETDRKGLALRKSTSIGDLISRVRWQTGDLAVVMAALYHEQRTLSARAQSYKSQGKTAEYEATIAALVELSQEIIAAQIQTGRAVNMAKVLSILPSQQALVVATRMKRRFTGNENAELTPFEAKQITDVTTKIEFLEKEVKKTQDRINRRSKGRTETGDKIPRKPRVTTTGKKPVKKTSLTIRQRLDRNLAQGFADSIQEVRDFLSNPSQDSPLGALANDAYVPPARRQAFGQVAAKLMQDGFDQDPDYDADKFAAQIAEMFGPSVEQFIDDIVNLGFETLAEAREQAVRENLIEQFADEADPETAADEEIQRRRDERQRRTAGRATLKKLASQATRRTGSSAAIDELNADATASDIAKVLAVAPDQDLANLAERVADEYGLPEVEAARKIIEAKRLLDVVKRNELIEKFKKEGDPAPEVSADIQMRTKKEQSKEKAKRNRELKRIVEEHDRKVEQLDEIAEKTDDIVVQYIANKLLEAMRPGGEAVTITTLLKDIDKQFGIGLEAARNKAREAKLVVDEIVQDRALAKAEAQGKNKEDLEKLKADKIALRREQTRLNQMLRSARKPTTLIGKFNAFLRGTFVFNWITQLFNFIQGFSMVGIQGFTDVVATAIRTIGGKYGMFADEVSPNVNLKTAWLAYGYLMANNRQVAEGIVAEFPEEWHRLELGIIADIPIEETESEGKKGLMAKAHKYADKLPKVTEFLAKISFAREQEIQMRTAIVMATLDQFARMKGTTLKEAVDEQRTAELFTEEEVREAVTRALRATFALPVDDKAGQWAKALYDQIDKYVPVFLNPVVYLRFTYTTTKIIANGFLAGALDLERLGGKGYKSTSLAQGVAAWSSVLLAAAMLAEFEGDDEEWYTLYVNGKDEAPIDVRRWYPMSVSFFIAHNIRLAIAGKPIMGLDEAIQAFASIEYDYYARSAGVEAVKAAYDAAFNRAEKPDADEALWKASAKMMGSVMGGMLRVLTPAKRLVSTFYEEEAKLRNYKDSAASEFIGEIAKSVPGLGVLYQAPPLIDPVTLKPVTEQKPYMRFFGFNYIHQMFTRPKPTTAEALAQQMFPANFTTPLKDQDKVEAARVRSEIKQALRRGDINEARAEVLVEYHVSKGTLSEQQGKRLKSDLKLTYLEEIIKYRVSLKDKDHVKKIKELMRKASPRERALIMEILANKELPD